MNQAELDYQNHNATISVPLVKPKKDFIDFQELKENEIKVLRFEDYEKFMKYVSADFVYEIVEKCNADFLGYCENEVLYPDTLPTAIEIVSKAIKQKKNAVFKDYLEQTKEMMELALSLGTFVQFDF